MDHARNAEGASLCYQEQQGIDQHDGPCIAAPLVEKMAWVWGHSRRETFRLLSTLAREGHLR